MAKRAISQGATSVLVDIFIQDSTSSTGAGLPGLVFNSAGLTAYYHRENGSASVAITLATMTLGTWATGGFKEVDATNMPGWYQVGLPNAAVDFGASYVGVHLKGATNMVPLPLEMQLDLPTNADSGTAQAGGASTITLRAGASAVDNIHRGEMVRIVGGTGVGQARAGTGYVGSTKVLTVDEPWQTNPDSTSIYVVTATRIPKVNSSGEVVAASVTAAVDILQAAADKVWASTTRTLTAFSTALAVSVWDVLASAVATASSIGLQLKTNVDAAVTSRLAPTTPGRTLDVAATGEAGLDFDNIKDATGAHTLTNITVPAVTLTATTTNVTNDVGITQTGADKVWSSATRTLTAFSTALAVSVWDVLASAVATASSIGLQLKTNIDATISSRLASASYTAPPSVASISTQVWTEPVPGSFLAGSAGFILGTNLNALVSSRSSHTAADIWAVGSRTLTAFGFSVTVGTNNDKTGYSLTVTPPTAAQIASQILATVLAELPQAQPSATPTVGEVLIAPWMELTNQTTADATSKKVRNRAGTVVYKSALSDDGTTFTKDVAVAGP